MAIKADLDNQVEMEVVITGEDCVREGHFGVGQPQVHLWLHPSQCQLSQWGNNLRDNLSVQVSKCWNCNNFQHGCCVHPSQQQLQIDGRWLKVHKNSNSISNFELHFELDFGIRLSSTCYQLRNRLVHKTSTGCVLSEHKNTPPTHSIGDHATESNFVEVIVSGNQPI